MFWDKSDKCMYTVLYVLSPITPWFITKYRPAPSAWNLTDSIVPSYIEIAFLPTGIPKSIPLWLPTFPCNDLRPGTLLTVAVPSYGLTNLPTTMEEIRLYNPKMVDIKLPFGCKLYINDILQ